MRMIEIPWLYNGWRIQVVSSCAFTSNVRRICSHLAPQWCFYRRFGTIHKPIKCLDTTRDPRPINKLQTWQHERTHYRAKHSRWSTECPCKANSRCTNRTTRSFKFLFATVSISIHSEYCRTFTIPVGGVTVNENIFYSRNRFTRITIVSFVPNNWKWCYRKVQIGETSLCWKH